MAIASSGGYLVAMENETTAVVARPSWFQTICAMLVMGFAAAVVSSIFVMIEAIPPATSGGFFVLVPALLLLVTQYLGMFRFNTAALVITMLLLLILTLWTLILLLITVQLLQSAPDMRGLLPFSSVLLLCVMFALSIRANWLRHASLKLYQKQGTLLTHTNSFSIRELMAATLLLACMLGPAAYQAGQNQSLYIQNVTPREAPFLASPTAQNITVSRTRDGFIQAMWTDNETQLHNWFDTQRSRMDVDRFLIVESPRKNTTVRIPLPPGSWNGAFRETVVPTGRIVFWDIEDRHVHITYSVDAHSGEATVYYRESRRD